MQAILGIKNIENWNKSANFLFAREARAKFLPRESFMIVGKQVKDCWGKKMRGWGKLIKEEMVFPHVIFPQAISKQKNYPLSFPFLLFLFPFSLSFSFPLFPSVSVFILPPLAIVFCTTYTPDFFSCQPASNLRSVLDLRSVLGSRV